MAKDISIRVQLINAIEAGAAAVGNRLKTMADGIRANLAQVSVAMAALAAGVAVAIKQTVQAFMESEASSKKLESALKLRGDNVDQLLPKYKALATAIAQQTTLDDDAVVAAMALGRNMGITAGNLEKATVAAVGLSEKYGMGLEPAMELVSKAASGNTESLQRYGIMLSDTLSPQEKFAELLNQGADAFDSARGAADTTQGKLKQLAKAYGELQEDIGQAIVESGVFQEALAWVKAKIEEIRSSGALEKWAESVTSTFDAVAKAAQWVSGVLTNTIGRVAGFAGALAGGSGIKEAWKQAGDIIKEQNKNILAIDRETQDAKRKNAIDVIDDIKMKELDATQEIKKGKLDAEKEIKKAVEDRAKAIAEIAEKEQALLEKQQQMQKQIDDERQRMKENEFAKDVDKQKKLADDADARVKESEDKKTRLMRDRMKARGKSEKDIDDAIAEREEDRARKLAAKVERGVKLSKRDKEFLEAFGQREQAMMAGKVAQANVDAIMAQRHKDQLLALDKLAQQLDKLRQGQKQVLDIKPMIAATEATGKTLGEIKRETEDMNSYLKQLLQLS
jgi:hypothetical protein